MKLERMSRRERLLTPPAFAAHLVSQVRRLTGARRVAVLYADVRGPYPGMPDVEVWPLWAESYRGPWPVIAHPPCGPWGKFRWRCFRQDPAAGIEAVRQARLWGGVVEQPVGSTLFRHCRVPPGDVEQTVQGAFGHRAAKATLLYWST